MDFERATARGRHGRRRRPAAVFAARSVLSLDVGRPVRRALHRDRRAGRADRQVAQARRSRISSRAPRTPTSTKIRARCRACMLATEWRKADFDAMIRDGGWPDVDPRRTVLLENAPAGAPTSRVGRRHRAHPALPQHRDRRSRPMRRGGGFWCSTTSGIRGGGRASTASRPKSSGPTCCSAPSSCRRASTSCASRSIRSRRVRRAEEECVSALAALKSRNTMSGALVLWRDGTVRPAQSSAALARLKSITGAASRPGCPCRASRAAPRRYCPRSRTSSAAPRTAGPPRPARSSVTSSTMPLAGRACRAAASRCRRARNSSVKRPRLRIEHHVLDVDERPAGRSRPARSGTTSRRRSSSGSPAAAGARASSRRRDRAPALPRRAPDSAVQSWSRCKPVSTRSPTRTGTWFGRQKLGNGEADELPFLGLVDRQRGASRT